MIVLDLDATTRAHLARALAGHRRWCHANGYAWPAALESLALVASSGQERTPGDDEDTVDDAAHVPLAYTLSHAGELLDGVSERTIRRYVDAGKLPVVELGRTRRVLRSDLEDFLARQRREVNRG